MCGIAGWVTMKRDIGSQEKIMKDMILTLSNRGPDDEGVHSCTNALLGHRRLTVVDPEGGAQPMIKEIEGKQYTIVYNGELYNTEDVRLELKGIGHSFKSYSDTEVLLTAYIQWGVQCLDHINGIFAFGIWDEHNKRFFGARDPLGVKPFFYTYKDDSLVFASELKTILKHPDMEPVVNKEGLLEIFGLGPARSLGSGVFKDIHEVPPAHFIFLDSQGLRIKKYWELEAKPHDEDLDTTVDHLQSLLIDAIERQLVSDVPICTFLSGGLDSSAISAIAANYFKRNDMGLLNTFSIDYEDNAKYFKANEFQPNSDSMWIDKMVDFIGSKHHGIVLNNQDLVEYLDDAVRARDLPGMADIDSSLYLFAREVRKKATVALSGECADEIFGGYPWYTNMNSTRADTFPWSSSVKDRRDILSNDFKDLPLEEFVREKYSETLNQVPKLKGEALEDERMREMFYLNIKWFMVNLLNRKDRMTMANSLEVRVPFADYRLVEYAYNIPKHIKLCDNREKGLLRRALADILPNEIVNRKKSPYPKTHHPEYTKAVQGRMRKILENKNSPVLQLIDIKNVKEIVDTGGSSFKKPWFGQLMTGPQLIAFLIQLNIWLEEYNVKIID